MAVVPRYAYGVTGTAAPAQVRDVHCACSIHSVSERRRYFATNRPELMDEALFGVVNLT